MSTRVWLGNAVAVKDVWTITVADTWATNDTVTITINGKDLVITIGANTTTAQVATTIKEAWESATLTDTTAAVSPLGGGASIPEMAELTATVSGSVVTLTADTAGVPHTISVTESTAGDGTASESNATAATGPNFFTNADNWSGTTVPISSDDVIFDARTTVDLLYGLSQSAITLTSLTVNGFTGKIGLPERNSNGYDEYRTGEFTISATTVTISKAAGSGSGRIRLNTGSNACTLNVLGTGTATESGLSAVRWRGSHASNVVDVRGGTVGIAASGGDAATVATLRQSAGTVRCGSAVELTNVEKVGGSLTLDSATTSIDQQAGTVDVLSGAHTAITASGGTVNYHSSGTIATLTARGDATVDFDLRKIARSVTNCVATENATLRDTAKTVTWTNGIDLQNTGISKRAKHRVNLDIGENFTLTPSAI